MEIQITARNLGTGGVTEGIRNYINKKFTKLKRYFHQIINMHITLYIERENHVSEIVISGDGLNFFARESSPDMYASIDLLYDNIERQIRRHKEKQAYHKFISLSKTLPFLQFTTPRKSTTSIKHQDIFQKDKPMSEEEAALQLEISKYPCIAFMKPEEVQKDKGIYYYITKDSDNSYTIYHLEKDKDGVVVVERKLKWEDNSQKKLIETSHSKYPIPKAKRDEYLKKIQKSKEFSGFYIAEDDENWVHFSFKDRNGKIYDVRTSLKV